MKRVVCFGEALIDFLNTGREQAGELALNCFTQFPGGAPANAAVAVAKSLGARVIAAASSAEKRDYALRCGADAVIDYNSVDWREALRVETAQSGLEMVVDPVGGAVAEPSVPTIFDTARFVSSW